MVKSSIVSVMNANRLYWLGRYEERVYLTLHLLRKCYDAMIDGTPSDYATFWQKLDAKGNYSTEEEFTLGMMYDECNPCSVISAQTYALDNAMMLRNYIATETQAFLEMSVSLLKRKKMLKETNITELQPVTDWSLAFWGSADERVNHRKVRLLMTMGRKVETIDMLLRFDYPWERINKQFKDLVTYLEEPEMYDANVLTAIEQALADYKASPTDAECKGKLLQRVNSLVRI